MFIKNLFDVGERDPSQKVSHEKAAQIMEAAKDPKNPALPRFRATELLTYQQINGLFTRFKKAQNEKEGRKRKPTEDEEGESDDINCGDEEEEEDDESEEEAEIAPPPKKPLRRSDRLGLKNRLQFEEEQEIEEIRKTVRKQALFL